MLQRPCGYVALSLEGRSHANFKCQLLDHSGEKDLPCQQLTESTRYVREACDIFSRVTELILFCICP